MLGDIDYGTRGCGSEFRDTVSKIVSYNWLKRDEDEFTTGREDAGMVDFLANQWVIVC